MNDYLFDKIIDQLRSVDHPSIWGLTIKATMQNGGNLDELINNLASQAVDSPSIMAKIVGHDLTTLLITYSIIKKQTT